MANKTLHSLQFPGLSDVYVLPEEASEFSTSSTYAVGQYVTYRGVLYKCTTAVTTAGSWTGATNWSATDVGTELRSIDSNHYTKTEEDSLLATKQNTLTFDNLPAFGSQNPVKSDGIFKYRVPMYGMGKNLLDNWYFGNPINQRGESSYTATQNGYTIDRWYCNQPRGTVGITNSVIQLTKTTTGSFQFTQQVNSFNVPCTFSVLLSTGSASGITISIIDTNGTSLASGTPDAISGKQLVTCYYDGTGATPVDRVIIAMSSSVAANTSISLYAVKLELGNQQTLCHNEGTSNTPIWVFNEAQDYEYELYRCMTSTADRSDAYANKSLATEQQIAYVENDIVASQAYHPGQYFCWNGLLYRAIEEISIRSAFTPGTNCVQATTTEGLGMLAQTAELYTFTGTTSATVYLAFNASKFALLSVRIFDSSGNQVACVTQSPLLFRNTTVKLYGESSSQWGSFLLSSDYLQGTFNRTASTTQSVRVTGIGRIY